MEHPATTRNETSRLDTRQLPRFDAFMAGIEPNPVEIFQRLHDSEINGAVSWFFDGVWKWSIGDEMNGWRREGHANDLETAVHDLAENAAAEFPESTFAAWWTKISNG